MVVTVSDHPSIQELAEYDERLLPGQRQDEVAAHLQACDDCRQELGALRQVTALLADAALQPTPMPAEVRDRIGAALASQSTSQSTRDSRGRDVPALNARRAAGTADRSHRRALQWLAAAAVVVVGSGAAAAVLHNQPPTVSAGSAASQAKPRLSVTSSRGKPSGAQVAPEPSVPFKGSVVTQHEQQRLTAYARQLAAGTRTPKPLSSGCEATPAPPGTLQSGTTLDGRPARLTVEPHSHIFTVYSCASAGSVEYRGSY